MSYIAGSYKVSILTNSGAVVIGDTDGIYVGWSSSMEMIDATDSYGRTPIDGIYRGGYCYITLNMITVDPLILAEIIWPQSTLGNLGTIGKLASTFSQQLTLTKIAGPNASPEKLIAGTAAYPALGGVVPAPDFPIRVNLAPSLSKMTLRFLLLPYTATVNAVSRSVWFTTGSGTTTPTVAHPYMAGAYTVLWNSLALGDTDLNSLQLEWMLHYEPIVGDSGGDVVQDLIYQGASAFINMVLLEANAAGIAAAWPYGLSQTGAQGVIQDLAGTPTNVIGTLHTTTPYLAKAMTLTPYAYTPAATYIASIGATYAVLAPGAEVSSRLGPTLRKLPLRVILFPSAGQLFTVTAAT